MTLFVDTSVWSLALRRDHAPQAAEAGALRKALENGELIVTTGLVLQELLQGFAGPRARGHQTDRDFVRAADHCSLRVWKPAR